MVDVGREDDPDRLVGLEVDVRVMVRRVRRFGDPIHERHRALKPLEREGFRQGVAVPGPARSRGEERTERGLIESRLVFGDRHAFEPSLYAFRTRRPNCVILTSPKLCEPTWLVEPPVLPVTYAKTGASAGTQSSVPAHAARKGSPSCPTSSSRA